MLRCIAGALPRLLRAPCDWGSRLSFASPPSIHEQSLARVSLRSHPLTLSVPELSDNSLDAYHFDLPEELIAQRPAERRDGSRLLILHRDTGHVENSRFVDLSDFLRPEDLVVFNNTRVFPARLIGRREPGGGQAELLLVSPVGEDTWDALARPGRKIHVGTRLSFGGTLQGQVTAVHPDGKRRVRFTASEEVETAIERVGRMPLPPYITRETEPDDRERYQTIFANKSGAVAAPTAGLHFTSEVMESLQAHGIRTEEVTLHVGYGTFEPVRAEDLRTHQVAPEQAEVSGRVARAVEETRRKGGRVVAVGTTTTRALEAAADEQGVIEPYLGAVDLTITPGYTFKVVDGLLSNFHLPRSSLLVLVSAFSGRERVLSAYQHAVEQQYRFYSYGDAMLMI